MNLAQSLDAGLLELPRQALRDEAPRLHPRIIAREHLKRDKTTEVVALVPGSDSYARLDPQQWQVVQLFDGSRSYAEIAALATEQGVPCSTEQVQQLAQVMDDLGFWYKTPQQSAAVLESQAEQRQQRLRKKSRFADLAQVFLLHWDPDQFLTRLHRRLGTFIFSRAFTLFSLALFVLMAYIFVDRWPEISRDTLEYFNFTHKSAWDMAEFWGLIFFIAGVHETAHGFACKHYGGGVHKMGILLIYLTPAFFCEVVEAYVYGGLPQRLITLASGIWSELVLCGTATVVWWGTAPGTFSHDFAYKFVLLCGIAGIMNLNPLIKTDGYLMLAEVIETPDLKEKSTALASSWSRHNLFRLPVQVPFYPRRTRWSYLGYAFLSGVYSYTLLLVVVRWTYNIFYHYTPDWAFVPALLLACLVFKSRLKAAGKVMNSVYLDRKETWARSLRRPRTAVLLLLVLAFLLVPWHRESVEARFVLEPAQRSLIRAEVPGQVRQVLAHEGERVPAGSPIARLANLQLESELADAEAGLAHATAQATRAQMQYAAYGPALQEQQRLAARVRDLASQQGKLTLASPIAGVLITPRLQDLQGSYLKSGATVAEVADLSTLRARIYVPEAYVRKVRMGADVALQPLGSWSQVRGRIGSLLPDSTPPEAGLEPASHYEGIRPAAFYVAFVTLPNGQGRWRDGMTGMAKLFGQRHSLAAFAWRAVSDFCARKLW